MLSFAAYRSRQLTAPASAGAIDCALSEGSSLTLSSHTRISRIKLSMNGTASYTVYIEVVGGALATQHFRVRARKVRGSLSATQKFSFFFIFLHGCIANLPSLDATIRSCLFELLMFFAFFIFVKAYFYSSKCNQFCQYIHILKMLFIVHINYLKLSYNRCELSL